MKKEHKVIKTFNDDGLFHLHIINNDSIKSGDYFYNSDNNSIQIASKETDEVGQYWGDIYFKVIATTDMRMKLPLLPTDFVDMYMKEGGIEAVYVEYEVTSNAGLGYDEITEYEIEYDEEE